MVRRIAWHRRQWQWPFGFPGPLPVAVTAARRSLRASVQWNFKVASLSPNLSLELEAACAGTSGCQCFSGPWRRLWVDFQ